MDGQKTEIDINKCGEMILVILLQTSGNYGRSGNREPQLRRSI